ncbi:xyloglucan galactosyltransferase KATAMARI1-like [Pyrus ussuriensis x Pyrus communis]|uniref:Xyloglucan galactosyltransferase KATAMARI1-like n=1 Tax=Pyrus ussuriensis x Pyrus communis TaxID=2448454 RepID=A0A5N5I6G0_9ROSA|nr:xyloglucan galactosyltransferase KATAMARI1-like [Pyrus ussuriensis x Pyrus communis]
MLSCMCCLPRRRKLLEFDFLAVVDGAPKIGAAKEVAAEGMMATGESKVIQIAK